MSLKCKVFVIRNSVLSFIHNNLQTMCILLLHVIFKWWVHTVFSPSLSFLEPGENFNLPCGGSVKSDLNRHVRQGDCAFACSDTFKELLNFQDGRGKTRKGTVSPQTCTAGLCWFESKSDKAKKDKKRSFTETSCSKKWDFFFRFLNEEVFFFLFSLGVKKWCYFVV